MGKISKPIVQNGRLQLPSQTHDIHVGTADWQAWLQAHDRFIFVGENGRLTARKETRRGQPYWYAYRRRKGKLKKVYLGRTEDLTLPCLRQADAKLEGVDHASLHSPHDFSAVVQETAVALQPVIHTKFQPPIQPQYRLKRPQLTAQMHTPIVVIHAPCGFGKSSLLSDWRQESEKQVAWLSLDSQDDDPVRFCQLLFTAVSAILPLVGAAPRLLPKATFEQMQTAMVQLINAVAAKPTASVALVLDGYHSITNEIIHQAMQFLFEHLPQTLQVLIASDRQLPFSLSRWRMAGLLTELTHADLRLSQQEGIAFLQAHPTTQALAYVAMRDLVQQTHGWSAGLHLAALAMKQQPVALASVESLIDGTDYFNEFFVENVLSRQETAVQQFLVQTSILKQLNGALCDAVLARQDSEQMLAQLWRANLFLNQLDGEPVWYQVHRLFTAVLKQQLQKQAPDLVPELHRRAARWYQAQDAPEEAVRHLLAIQAWEDAATLIESVAIRELHEKGEDSRLLRWVMQLPVEIVQHHRALLSIYIRLTNIALSQTHQLHFLDQVEANILQIPEQARSIDETAVLQEVQSFQQRLTTDQMDIAPDSEPTLGLTNNYLQGMQFFMKQDYATAEQWIARELEEAETSGNLFLTLLAGGGLAFTQLAQGRLRSGELIAQQVLRDVVARAGRLPEPTSPSFIVLAMIAYERNDLATAQKWVEKATEVDPNPTSANVPMTTQVLQARIQTAQGEFAAAHATLKAAFHLDPDRRSMIWSEQDLIFWQAWVFAREGRDEQAARQLTLAHLAGEQANTFEQPKDLGLLVSAEIHLAKGACSLAEETIENLLIAFPHGFRTGPIVYPLTMLATAQLGQNKVNQAQRTMEKALRLAAPEGMIRPFLDRGSTIWPLLSLIQKTGRLTPETHQFTEQLINRIGDTDGQTSSPSFADVANLTLAASISPRELEVIRLVGEGLSNQAIAARMMVTVSTVNTHLKHIYRKLDVHTRTEAVLRAQALQLPL